MSKEKLDLKKMEDAAKQAAQLGGQVLLDYFGQLTKVSEKFQAGLVSEADVESEKIICNYLKELFPGIAILGEEGGLSGQALGPEAAADLADLWLIDPLDGTTNYIHNLPFYCVSIGLRLAGDLVVGVCHLPSMGITYSAAKGFGSFKNSQKISVSRRSEFKDTLLATGFSSYDHSKHQLNIFASLVNQVRGVRRVGSAAYDMCLVAEGAYDGYWERGLSPWDTAAGTVIIREAGGIVTNYEGEQFDPFHKTVVAGNSVFQKTLQKHILNT